MSFVDPVEHDVRLWRQQMRRQKIKPADVDAHKKKVEDSKDNVAMVDLKDEAPAAPKAEAHAGGNGAWK